MKSNRLRVLIVDDDADARRLLGRHLTDGGYEVRGVDCALDALKVLHNDGPEILVIDWLMPGMNGLELVRLVRASESIGFVFIVVVTSQTGTSRLVEAFDAGVDDYMTKPIEPAEFVARLHAAHRILDVEHRLAREKRAVHKVNAELAVLNGALERIATTDELTGLFNRREALRQLREHWARSLRQNAPLSCVMFDIDHFKRFNDTHGHGAGDTVLRETARVLQHKSRAGEAVCRLGGEEFLIICPGASVEQATAGAERLRQAVEVNCIRHADHTLSVTASAGVAGRMNGVENIDDLLKAADAAMYQAKRQGRNRVCEAGEAEPDTPAQPEGQAALAT